jgi:hypothetical protein
VDGQPPRLPVETLRAILTDTVKEPRFQPNQDGWGNPAPGVTHCSQFVDHILDQYVDGDVFGTFEHPVRAVGQVRFMESSPRFVKCTNWDTAAAHAQRGLLVVAGEIGADGTSGHVCVLAPEPSTLSGSWMIRVPACANVGRSVFYGLRISRAFNNPPDAWLFLG